MSNPAELRDVLPGPPLVYRRRVSWADTDAARMAYTIRFLDFAMAAVETWFREVWGIGWYRSNVEQGVGTPFVHVDMDFTAALFPGDVVEIPVRIERLGNSSITFDLRGYKQDRIECFHAHYVCTCATTGPDVRALPIPDDKRRVVEAYMAACAEADGAAAQPATA